MYNAGAEGMHNRSSKDNCTHIPGHHCWKVVCSLSKLQDQKQMMQHQSASSHTWAVHSAIWEAQQYSRSFMVLQVQHHVSCLPLKRPMQPMSTGTLYESPSILSAFPRGPGDRCLQRYRRVRQ